MIRQQFHIVLISLGIFLSACVASAHAPSVTVQWDSNGERDLAGYTVFYGTNPRQYAMSVDVGNHTSYQFSDLDSGRTYYFAVRAYNSAGVQSALSTEVAATLGSGSLALTNFI